MSEDCIPLLEPGQTAGPFEIRIPREVIFYLTFIERTTRWERLRLRLHLMRREQRLEIWGRLLDVLDLEQ